MAVGVMPLARVKSCKAGADMRIRQRRVVHGVELVDRKHDGGHAQQVEQQRVAARLRQQRERSVAPVQLGGIDEHHGGVGLRGGGDHVARVLLVPRRVADDELARLGGKVAPGHVDGDALLALGLQAVGEQREVGRAAACDAREVVLQHRAAVEQQAPDQRAFAVIDRAAGDEAQRRRARAGV
jgi:hypothetical protein